MVNTYFKTTNPVSWSNYRIRFIFHFNQKFLNLMYRRDFDISIWWIFQAIKINTVFLLYLESLLSTGWSISILYTLIGYYDKNNACTKKIGVYLVSVYPEISFDNKKSEKITDISLHNRNNRNNNNNRNKLQKMFKMDSIVIGHRACIFFCYLSHIPLKNVMINLDKLRKTVKSAKISCFEANTSP